MSQNGDFICAICGKKDPCYSTLVLTAGYSSNHDTERASGHICGDCANWLWDSLGINKPGTKWTIENYFQKGVINNRKK